MAAPNFTDRDALSTYLQEMGINHLLCCYEPTVRTVAERTWKPSFESVSGVEVEDFVSVGLFEIATLIESWDPKESSFRTYVTGRLRFRMIDHLRECTRLSRIWSKRWALVAQARKELMHCLERSPTDEEVSEKLGWTMDKLRLTVSKAEFSSWHSITADTKGDDFRVGGEPYSLSSVSFAAGSMRADAEFFRCEGFRRLFRALPQYWDSVAFYLYGCLNLTMRETGLVIGISESRCSQAMSSYLTLLTQMFYGGMAQQLPKTLAACHLQEAVHREWEQLSARAREAIVMEFNLLGHYPERTARGVDPYAGYHQSISVDAEGAEVLGVGEAMITDSNVLLLSFDLRPPERS